MQINNSQVKGFTRANLTNARINDIVYVAHRGMPLLFPENTMEALRGSVRAGAKAIEFDVQLLADGTLGIMHDTTLTRTTSSTGNVSDQTALSMNTHLVDHGATLGGLYTSKTYPVPTFEEIIEEFGNKVVMFVDCKGTGVVDAAVLKLQAAGIATDSAVLLNSDGVGEFTNAVNAGYATMIYGSSPPAAATVAAADIDMVGLPTSASSGTISGYLAEDLEVAIYTVNRHVDRDTFVGYGVTIFMSDNAIYLSGEGYRLLTDPFGSQTWYHGMLSNKTHRGSFASTDKFLISAGTTADREYVNQGWACPIAGDPDNDNFVIDFKMNFDTLASTRWGGIFICLDNDFAYNEDDTNPNGGYHLLLRNTGTLQIYSFTTDNTATLLSETAGSTLSTGVDYPLRITVTPTGITFERTDISQSATTSNTIYRGGYFGFSARLQNVNFKDVVIS